jgi:hypothetical protein
MDEKKPQYKTGVKMTTPSEREDAVNTEGKSKQRIPEPRKTVNFFGEGAEKGTQQSRSRPIDIDKKTIAKTTTTSHNPFPF